MNENKSIVNIVSSNRLALALCLIFTTPFATADNIADSSTAQNSINHKLGTGKISTVTLLFERKLSEQFLYAEQWELARSGESILSLPALNKIINLWLQDKNKKIQIQYPGGEEGELWVQELTDWLVSLGISSNNMVVARGSGADDLIKLDLIK